MSPLGILRLVDKSRFKEIYEMLLQHGDDLDYVQSLINLIGERSDVNPPMNAVSDAFNRRRFTRRFKQEGQSVELDALLNDNTKGDKDDDTFVQRKTKKQSSTGGVQTCFLFQSASCHYQQCRYRHVCMKCQSTNHGSLACTAVTPSSNQQTRAQTTNPSTSSNSTRPPNARFRRDRAYPNRSGTSWSHQ